MASLAPERSHPVVSPPHSRGPTTDISVHSSEDDDLDRFQLALIKMKRCDR